MRIWCYVLCGVVLVGRVVAILGGGACAQTFAADLSLAGWRARLFELPEFAPRSLGDALETHEIELTGVQSNFRWFSRSGVAKVDVISTDISEVVPGADLVIVAVPAIAHKVFFEKLIPYLEDGQVVSIFPDNFGSLVLSRMMRERDVGVDITLGGWSSMPYGTRVVEPGKVDCMTRIYRLRYDALPSTDREKFIAAFKGFPPFDGVSRIETADTVIGVGFSNPNPVVHVPGSILSVGPMEVSESEGTLGIPKGRFSMYKHGMAPSVSRVQLEFYRELKKIANAYGIKITEYSEEQFFWKLSVMGVEYACPFAEALITPIWGPTSVKHRYFIEDIGVGTVAFYSFAKKAGVDVPIIESLIRLGCIICQVDFFREGRTLAELGLEHMTVEQIVRFVREGVLP